MKIRATANATERSNAIGTVQLECTPGGLVLTYLGVGAFSEGYAVGALTHGTQITVPWSQVVSAQSAGEQLFLAIDPQLTPHHQMVLTHFTSGDVVDPRELFRQRLVLRVGGVGAALLGMALLTLTLPRVTPEVGGAAALGIGMLFAVTITGLALVTDARLGRGSDELTVREALVGELERHLPHLIRTPRAPRKPPKPITIPTIQGFLPRTTFAIAATLAAGILGALLTARWIVSGGAAERYAKQRWETARSEAASELRSPSPQAAPAAPSPPPQPATTSASTPSPAAPAPLAGACRCARADSALWDGPIPRVSALLIGQRSIQRREKNRVKSHLEVSIAAVNNGDEAIEDVTFRVHFFEQDPPPSNKRYSVADRAMYFEGPLGPGKAIKWTVEARGTSFELENPYTETLAPDGINAAPTNLLAQLLHANHRPVRLHGAMMLAYLNDPRARQAVLDLREALREDEAPYLRRLIQATGDLRVCQLRVSGSGSSRDVRACVYNASREAKRNVGIQVRALEYGVSHTAPVALPPTMLMDTKWKVASKLAPGNGVVATGEFDVSMAPSVRVFEAHADRFDLLE